MMATRRRVPDAEQQWLRVLGTLNELQARVCVAQRAVELGRGGISRFDRLRRARRREDVTEAVVEIAQFDRGRLPGCVHRVVVDDERVVGIEHWIAGGSRECEGEHDRDDREWSPDVRRV